MEGPAQCGCWTYDAWTGARARDGGLRVARIGFSRLILTLCHGDSVPRRLRSWMFDATVCGYPQPPPSPNRRSLLPGWRFSLSPSCPVAMVKTGLSSSISFSPSVIFGRWSVRVQSTERREERSVVKSGTKSCQYLEVTCFDYGTCSIIMDYIGTTLSNTYTFMTLMVSLWYLYPK